MSLYTQVLNWDIRLDDQLRSLSNCNHTVVMQVRDLLGDNIQLISNNVSQSMSMSSINGRMTKQVTIAFAVAGSSGRSAQAQVSDILFNTSTLIHKLWTNTQLLSSIRDWRAARPSKWVCLYSDAWRAWCFFPFVIWLTNILHLLPASDCNCLAHCQAWRRCCKFLIYQYSSVTNQWNQLVKILQEIFCISCCTDIRAYSTSNVSLPCVSYLKFTPLLASQYGWFCFWVATYSRASIR